MTKHPEIPTGRYCYTVISVDSAGRMKTKVCPHWDKKIIDGIMGAHCKLLKKDSEDLDHRNLLWDKVKQCKINEKADIP